MAVPVGLLRGARDNCELKHRHRGHGGPWVVASGVRGHLSERE